MHKVAIIFDQFEHPNQAFWSRIYNALKADSRISIEVLAGSNHSDSEQKVNFLKSKSTKTKIKHLITYLNYKRNYSYLPIRDYLLYANYLNIKSNCIHFLNAQQFPEYLNLSNGKKLIFSFRGYETLVRPYNDSQWLETLKTIYQRADVLHFVSNYILKEAIDLGAEPKKCNLIYRSVDLDFYKKDFQQREKDGIIQITTVGRLIWQKGYLYGLEALKQLKDSGIKFQYNIIGEGPDLQELIFHVNRLQLSDHVIFHGQKNKNEIKNILDLSDIFLQPSISEALPNSILEASAMSLPIVACNAGGIKEAVNDGETGFICEIANSNQLYDQLLQLSLNSDLRLEMGKKARDFMELRFHPKRELEEYISMYQNTMSK